MTLNICHIRIELIIAIFFTKFDVGQRQPICSWYKVLAADTLHHAVTLTFDPLTLNVYSVSAVTWSNSVPIVSEMELSAAELWRLMD